MNRGLIWTTSILATAVVALALGGVLYVYPLNLQLSKATIALAESQDRNNDLERDMRSTKASLSNANAELARKVVDLDYMKSQFAVLMAARDSLSGERDSLYGQLQDATRKLEIIASTPGWKQEAGWNALKQQMTVQEVLATLGSPPLAGTTDVETGFGYGQNQGQVWFYPANDSISGRVYFGKQGLVTGWRMPFGMSRGSR